MKTIFALKTERRQRLERAPLLTMNAEEMFKKTPHVRHRPCQQYVLAS